MGLNHMNGRVEDAITGRFLISRSTDGAKSGLAKWAANRYVALRRWICSNCGQRVNNEFQCHLRCSADGEFRMWKRDLLLADGIVCKYSILVPSTRGNVASERPGDSQWVEMDADLYRD